MALITYPLKSPVQRAHQIRSLARDTPLMLFLCKSKTASPVKSRTASSVPVIAHYTTSTRVGVAELFRPTVKQSHCNNDRSHMRGATYHWSCFETDQQISTPSNCSEAPMYLRAVNTNETHFERSTFSKT
jgi:hypothetical protein